MERAGALRINIEGQRFNRLTALHDVGRSKSGQRLWECLCDCGQFTIVPAKRLRNGNTKSCGCLHRELSSKRAKTGLHKLPIGEANLNNLINAYKQGAKKRNLKFLLTKDQFEKFTQQVCWYCGIKPRNIMNFTGSNGKFIYNGIDRIDNTKGYMVDNCITCCSVCNRMRNACAQQEFLTKIELIHNHMLENKNG